MTVFKRIIAVMLCIVMLACAVASCDQNKDDSQSSETAKELQSSESTTETSAKTSEVTTKDTESSKETESDTEKDDSNQNGTHVHNYNVKNTDKKYLKIAAKYDMTYAVYFYSCMCGETGTDTFAIFPPEWTKIYKTVYCIKDTMNVYSATEGKAHTLDTYVGREFNVVATDGEYYKTEDRYAGVVMYIKIEDTTDNIGMVTFTKVDNSSIEVEDPRENVIIYSDLGMTKAFEVPGMYAIGAFTGNDRIKVTGFNQTRDFLSITYQGYDSEDEYHNLDNYYCYAKGISIWYNDDDLRFN